MRAPGVSRLSAPTFRRFTLVNVVLLVAIIVSGAIVRLTSSGLGCADWPRCSATHLVSVSTDHAAIEQLNRIFSGLIGVPIALALVGAYRRAPRRRDLVHLAWLLLALFLAEAVIGGVSVKVKLAWVSVMGHFLLALALVGVALVLHRRAGEPEGARRPTVARGPRLFARAIYGGTIWVLVAGTLVTAAGPHGGDAQAKRLSWPIADAARVHGASVDLLVLAVLVLVHVLVRARAPRRVLLAISAVLAVMVAEAILGYVQYFLAIPVLLVGFHVLGAVLAFASVQQLQLELRAPDPGRATAAAPSRGAAVGVAS